MSAAVEKLRWVKLPVLDDGYVCLVDIMGDDSSVVQAARVSYGAGTKSVSDDRGLIRYLMRRRHSTPFEMVELKFLVRVPMDTWRQWVRHRTANINEYSTRYSEAIDSQQTTPDDQWRLQSTGNKQGSSGFVEEWPASIDKEELDILKTKYGTPGNYLSCMEAAYIDDIKELYQERLKYGVAREQARKDLPLSTYTEAYWKIDLHNLLHFLALRMDSHAQLEIRQYANAIGEIVKELLPLTWEAFEDYRLNSISLSSVEVDVIRDIVKYMSSHIKLLEDTDTTAKKVVDKSNYQNDISSHVSLSTILSKREKEEITQKLQLFGILTGESQ
jgi:thymidylate synthase (FAD)